MNSAGPAALPPDTETAAMNLFRKYDRSTGTQGAVWLPADVRAAAADLAVDAAHGIINLGSFETIPPK